MPKAVERAAAPTSVAPSNQSSQAAPASRNLGDALSSVKDKPDDFAVADQVAATQSTETQIQKQAAPLSEAKAEPIPEQLPPSRSASGSQQPEVHASLAEIKSLL